MGERNTKRTLIFLVLTCAWWSIHRPSVSEAQQREPLPIEAALRVHSFGGFGLTSIDLSHDGKWVAYVVRDNVLIKSGDTEASVRTGIPFGTNDIFISNITTGKARNLTGGKSENWLPVWSPDGHTLAFLSDRDGSGQAKLWVWDMVKNELKKVSDVAVRTDQIEWMPDSHGVLLTVMPEGLSAQDHVSKVTPSTGIEKPVVSRTEGSTVALYKSSAVKQADKEAPQSDPWSLDYVLRDLVLVDLVTGKTNGIVHGKRITKFLLSPHGSRVAYTIPKRFEKPGSQQILFDLSVIVFPRMEARVVASEIRLDYDGAAFSWSPNGLQLGFHTGGMEERIYDSYVVDAENGSPRNVSNLKPAKVGSRHTSEAPVWDTTGGRFYFLHDGALWRASEGQSKADEVARIPDREMTQIIPKSDSLLWMPYRNKSTIVLTHDDFGKQDGFYMIDLESRGSKKLFEKGQCYTCVNVGPLFTVTKDGQQVVYFAEDAQHDEDMWISDVAFQSPRRLTHLNPQFDKYKTGAAQLIDWSSDDGERLQGVLLLPADYQEGKRYPLIVYVYGGVSLSNNLDRFGLGYGGPFNMQLLATRGYAILLPNAPQHLGTPMLDLAKTVLPGVSKVIEMGIADPARLGVMGHSYGGYSTLALIVQTNRFKAAVMADGYGDLIGSYGQMAKDGSAYGIGIQEHAQGLMGGSPWQYRDRYLQNSPIFYLDRLETPLLIVHGGSDTTVAPFLGDQIFVGLRRLGKEVEYAKYEGEQHSPLYWSYANQMDYCDRMIAWFDAHLKKPEDQKPVPKD